jgi:hypothetical protein
LKEKVVLSRSLEVWPTIAPFLPLTNSAYSSEKAAVERAKLEDSEGELNDETGMIPTA